MNRKYRRSLNVKNKQLGSSQLNSIAQEINAQIDDFLGQDGEARLQTVYELAVGIQLMGKYISMNGLVDDCRRFHEKNNLNLTKSFNKSFTPDYLEVKNCKDNCKFIRPLRDGIVENKVFIDACPERAGHYCRGDFVRGKECTASICPYKPGSPNYDHSAVINADKPKEKNDA